MTFLSSLVIQEQFLHFKRFLLAESRQSCHVRWIFVSFPWINRRVISTLAVVSIQANLFFVLVNGPLPQPKGITPRVASKWPTRLNNTSKSCHLYVNFRKLNSYCWRPPFLFHFTSTARINLRLLNFKKKLTLKTILKILDDVSTLLHVIITEN